MKSFFGSFFAALLALFVFSIGGFMLLIGFAAAFSSDEAVTVPTNAVLVIDLNDNFTEKEVSDPFTELMNPGTGKIPSLTTMIGLIQHAKKDSNIKGIYIKCQQNSNGYASSEELRKALLDFKKSNKFIFAYGETISQKGYWVGNVANQIYTHPQGGLEFSGFSLETVFLKGMLDKLDVEMQVFYAGKFKSATEPFRYTKMSDANKQQTGVWLNGLYDHFINSVASARQITPEKLKVMANEAKIQSAQDALSNGLVDGLIYDDQLKKMIAKKLKGIKENDIPFVSVKEYAKSVPLRGTGAGKIAVVYADGDIVMGKNVKDAIASDDFRMLLQKIRADESIDALVLRVNSPGGSALASDIIWREIELIKGKIPVIVSMGDVAASGGYYIASGADSIYADANTITGSIGVFTVIPNISGFMNNKLGISFDGVKTAPYADAPSATRPLNMMEQKMLQSGVDSIYHTFKSRVSKGRKKSMDYVDSIAQGRVWLGSDAINVGLVDRIGTLNDALASAAKMAKLKGYSIKQFPESKSFLEDLIEDYKDYVKVKSIESEIGVNQWQIFQNLKTVQQMVGAPQARMPIFVVKQP
ncbi:MAG: signal peptide peptidase SppA [Chitinophagaceae bacterium]|nr:signal peptide peptidase SppA [Chitinophagaceae bacterium]MCF8289625.1 signal peptide peptidase SppA [Chitinophagaceae bacterium]MCF8422131.1 signal peptide peptidase SppA [Chitinophagaceae bacterium]